MKLLSYKAIRLGDLTAHQLTVFEHKRLFSLILYYFRGDGWQDRYHDHAFDAISIRVFGRYRERVLLDERTGERLERDRSDRRVMLFRRSCFHMLGISPGGCLTILLAGPWGPTWREWKDGRTRTLRWGRRTEA